MPSPRVLLVCEGEEDKRFFQAIVAAYGLNGVGLRIISSNGKDNFAQRIDAWDLEQPGIYRQLKAVLIVADKNDEPKNRFENVQLHIERLRGPGSAPAEQMKPSSGNRPPIYILMIPTDLEKGHLEAQCHQAAMRADKLAGSQTSDFLALAKADKWGSDSRWYKAWLRANLAIRCSDPGETLARVFSETKHEKMIPMPDPAFNKIVDALKFFAPA